MPIHRSAIAFAPGLFRRYNPDFADRPMNAADSMKNGQHFASLNNTTTNAHVAGFRGLNITGTSHLPSSMIHPATTEPLYRRDLEIESNHSDTYQKDHISYANSMVTPGWKIRAA